MLQRLSIIISGKGPDFTVLLNNTTFKAKDGVLVIEDMDSLKIKERSIYAFDDEVSQLLNEDERQRFYEMIQSPSPFGKVNVETLLEIGKDEASEIVDCAFKHNVLLKAGHQWKLNRDVRDQVRAFAKLQVTLESKTMKELMTEKMDELRTERKSGE